jgi:general secretion pathway protein J
MRRRLRQGGFTLLELLIAITLLGLILVLLFGGLRLGMRSWDAGQLNVDTMNTVRSVEGFLRGELGRVYPYRWKKGLGQRMAFLGERYKLSFVAPLPSRIGGGGLYVMSMMLEQNGDEKRIVWKQLPVSAQMQDFSMLEDAREMELVSAELSGVEEVWLTYFGPESDGAEPAWKDRWENDKRLPQLIRVQIRLKHGAEWPDFVVAPMLSSDLAG